VVGAVDLHHQPGGVADEVDGQAGDRFLAAEVGARPLGPQR
jgi:hypothetical protein